MLILWSTDANLSEGLNKALGDIRELATQIICYFEDLEDVPDEPEPRFPLELDLQIFYFMRIEIDFMGIHQS
ncbi:uncharacterized protein TRIVIDRAFT_218500 [Trichoderma virens Gv29-8]|uniref:Uncharacterized protein n=1 Tax=Hypocrea virens (strain Gv29-8 / FGSC 10586) TaxID=413071 RepID=G9MHZ8_HYPVG|nr:uncharacterized protein TRIVIDRAFT_218500 [Trichoderma virens Gv29-8]EHK26333.1 hypothetical protein TRIVIDRAFT_218500 [Trichoderma virens Gv29-8]UKZ46515.1 hypothetical protein TrVGV298_000720 [Trichoderma virens]